MKKLSFYIAILYTFGAFAQSQITLDQCYQLAGTNYPLIQQKNFLEQQQSIDREVLKTEKLPSFSLDAQATYQSAVIGIPIATITPPNKDQYRATLSVNQLIYGGGLIDASIKVSEAALKTQQKQVEVNLYALKKQINQLYFSVLLLQEKKALLIAKKTLLETKLKELKSGIKNGVIIPTTDKIVEAELLKLQQQVEELNSSKIVILQTLSSIIGKPISKNAIFKHIKTDSPLNSSITRPELALFQLKKEQITASNSIVSKQNRPKIMGFATGGYGNPGLNLLDNSFQGFYTVGVKLHWNVFDWNASKKKRKSLTINADIIDTETDIFELNTNIELAQQLTDIQKLEAFMVSDKEIIQLRKEILKSTEAQLQNGVITPSAYITELTNLFEDETNLRTHQIQQALLKANYTITKGN